MARWASKVPKQWIAAKPTRVGAQYVWTRVPAQAFDYALSNDANDRAWREDSDNYLEGQWGCAIVDSRGVFVEVVDNNSDDSCYYVGKNAGI